MAFAKILQYECFKKRFFILILMGILKQLVINSISRANKKAVMKAEQFEHFENKNIETGHFSHIWRNIMAVNDFLLIAALDNKAMESTRLILKAICNIASLNLYLFLLKSSGEIKEKEINSYDGYYGKTHTGNPNAYVIKLLKEYIKSSFRHK